MGPSTFSSDIFSVAVSYVVVVVVAASAAAARRCYPEEPVGWLSLEEQGVCLPVVPAMIMMTMLIVEVPHFSAPDLDLVRSSQKVSPLKNSGVFNWKVFRPSMNEKRGRLWWQTQVVPESAEA
jgi:hypothetical protein